MFDSLLRFAPLYQPRVWGGRRLETLLGRALPEQGTPFGESWEVSDRVQEQSRLHLASGGGLSLHDLWMQHREAVFGADLLHHPALRYPLLMKILDAEEDLSIQVHPPAEIATSLGGEAKTEMWYVLHAEPGAKLYAGLRAGIQREAFDRYIREGTVAEAVQILHPSAGDCLFIPSGLIHAIGAGLVVYEVQQNSDTTYRVFDWNRLGLDGRPRALHLAESLQSIDFSLPPPTFQIANPSGRLICCNDFEVTHCTLRDTPSLGHMGQHLTVAVVSGHIAAAGMPLNKGDFAIVPACLPHTARALTSASQDASWLEIRIPSFH
jgi:mannose-6-phosphate isomerase